MFEAGRSNRPVVQGGQDVLANSMSTIVSVIPATGGGLPFLYLTEPKTGCFTAQWLHRFC